MTYDLKDYEVLIVTTRQRFRAGAYGVDTEGVKDAPIGDAYWVLGLKYNDLRRIYYGAYDTLQEAEEKQRLVKAKLFDLDQETSCPKAIDF